MANVKLKATGRFATSITINGELVWQDWAEGDERAVTETVAELLLKEVPGCLEVVKPKAKPQPKVETSAGATEDASTRQVAAAPKPKAKKPAAKGKK